MLCNPFKIVLCQTALEPAFDFLMFPVCQAPVSVPQSTPVEQPVGSSSLAPPSVDR